VRNMCPVICEGVCQDCFVKVGWGICAVLCRVPALGLVLYICMVHGDMVGNSATRLKRCYYMELLYTLTSLLCTYYIRTCFLRANSHHPRYSAAPAPYRPRYHQRQP
jgi:hypothetical protein